MNRSTVYSLLTAVAAAAGLAACQASRNFTTYFNLFYNMERIMEEVEEELLFTREQKTPEPSFQVPFDDLERRDSKFYHHLERRSMNNEEMRANKVKLDSIIIKGSKLMARNAKSDYLDDAIFYIAKTWFYERDWYQSQKKCEELIAGFPLSKWYPDAHLVLSMDLMQQGKLPEAVTMISRTIDIGWAAERRDILIDAFRLNADVQLADGNIAEALRPYYRAMTLSTDNEDRARWQYEVGMIHFRRGDFQAALNAFDSVDQEYSPDVLVEFQTGLQRSAALRALERYDEAARQLKELRDNSNYEDWYGLVELEMASLASARAGGALAEPELARIDSMAPGKAYSSYALYERAVRSFRGGDFRTALDNFNKAKVANAPFQRRAQRYASQLERYFEQTGKGFAMTIGFQPGTFPDSMKAPVADAFYNTARVFAAFDMPDSVIRYYDLSYEWSAPGSPEGARVLYARSVMARDSGRSARADSLLELIVQNYPLTEYAADARPRLGYTEASKIDPAEDLFKSGVSNMNVGDIKTALAKFQRVVNEHGKSPYAPRAYYAIGLIYEKNLDQLDSAYSYYGRLMDRFPKSEQAMAVAPLLQAVNTNRMRKPNELPETQPMDGTGVNLDWIKENPPIEPDDGPEELVPLDGDTTKMRTNKGRSGGVQPGVSPGTGVPRPPGTKPAGGPSGTSPAATPPSGTPPKGTPPKGAPPKTTPPSDGQKNSKPKRQAAGAPNR